MGTYYKYQNDIIGEIWKNAEGFNGMYAVSNLGRMKSFKKGRWGIGEGRFINVSNNKKGYSSIYMNGKSRNVHRIVAQNFIPNPDNLPFVCHKDETLNERGALNNGADNLFWGTSSDNMIDKYNKGRANNPYQLRHPNIGKFGKLNPFSKKVLQYSKSGDFIKSWDSIADVKRQLGIDKSDIGKCCKGILKTVGGFVWEFNKS